MGAKEIIQRQGLCPPLRGSPAPGGGSFAPQRSWLPLRPLAGRVTPPPLRGHPTRVRHSAATWLRCRLFFVVPPKRGPADFRWRSILAKPGSREAAHTTSHRLWRGGGASPLRGAPTGYAGLRPPLARVPPPGLRRASPPPGGGAPAAPGGAAKTGCCALDLYRL